MFRTSLVACATFTLVPLASAAPAGFTPGEWETTLTMTAGTINQTESQKDCMNAREANAEYKTLVDEFAGGMGACTVSSFTERSNGADFTLTCTEPPFTTATGYMNKVSSTEFNLGGVFNLDLGGGNTLPATLVASSKRIGVCPN